ncbi:LBP / BPI / CETP family protein [Oesophagostomum dentatum]|uniref:LBP / BPI / CETP family protein n=1 Tax=Oesophagostomum dentatum TaxID=61180 RepID=A0A0B1T7X0_OESDE|nr:LBP / BPI / CETP family protein [Oesophagostomum dentatum]
MYLSSVPLHIPIGLNSSIDYTLQQMIYSKNFFDAMATAVVTEQCSSTEVENWTEDDLVPKMAVFWLSDIIPQCLLENAHSRRLFDYDVTKETASTAPFLSTSCSLSTFCVGRFFERLRNEYPEEYVDLHLHTLKAPIVQMGGDILTVVTSLAIDLHMNSNRTDDKPLARIELESTALLKPEIVNNTLSGSMSGIHNEFKLAFSQIGIPSKALLALLENAVSETLTSMVETIVQAGVPLPIHSSVALSDQSEIRVFDRCIRVNADFIPN